MEGDAHDAIEPKRSPTVKSSGTMELRDHAVEARRYRFAHMKAVLCATAIICRAKRGAANAGDGSAVHFNESEALHARIRVAGKWIMFSALPFERGHFVHCRSRLRMRRFWCGRICDVG
jgi:hypothetical protein